MRGENSRLEHVPVPAMTRDERRYAPAWVHAPHPYLRAGQPPLAGCRIKASADCRSWPRSSSTTWVYVLSNVWSEWPICSASSAGFTPSAKRRDATLWRRSYGRAPVRPTAAAAGENTRARQFPVRRVRPWPSVAHREHVTAVVRAPTRQPPLSEMGRERLQEFHRSRTSSFRLLYVAKRERLFDEQRRLPNVTPRRRKGRGRPRDRRRRRRRRRRERLRRRRLPADASRYGT